MPAMPLPRSEGVVIGHLFDRATGKRAVALPPGFDHAVTSTAGAVLLERYWGSYVALWTDPGRGVRLLRDPGGAVSAYRFEQNGALFVASDVDLIATVADLRLEIAWDLVARHLMYPDLPGDETAIVGLADTIPGTCHTFGKDRNADKAIWTPARFAAIDDMSHARSYHAERVRAAVEVSVAAWRGCFDDVALELSGGLDSSIVATALTATGRPWSGLTFMTDAADGDERHYARAVAERLGAHLQEVALGPRAVDVDMPYGRLTPRPRGTAFLQPLDRVMTEARDALGVEAIFTGLGGDHVFFSTQSTSPVLDALVKLGPRSAHSTAIDVAHLCGVPLVEVYRAALRRFWTQRPSRRWAADSRYLAAQSEGAPRLHPWLDLPYMTLHGTRARIATLLRALGFLDGVDRMVTRTTISPLLSQPVIEACLAVPSWMCVFGGRDRAVAREAFAKQLPEQVVHRRDKGRVDSLVVGRFEQQRMKTRGLLLDGLLAGAGLLDRKALERDLGRTGSDRDPFQDRLLFLVDAELWARAVIAGRR